MTVTSGTAAVQSHLRQLGPSGTGINGVRFFARSGGLEVGVGNIYGALEFMPGQYDIDLGLTGLGYDYTAYNFRGDAYSSGGTVLLVRTVLKFCTPLATSPCTCRLPT